MHSPTLPFDYQVLLSGVVAGALVLVLVVEVARQSGRDVPALLAVVFAWSLFVVAMVTLLPRDACHGQGCPLGPPQAFDCQWDVTGGAMGLVVGGGLALNVVLFVPSGILVGLSVLRAGRAALLGPVGVAGLAAYSVLIETTQRHLPALDRRCDVTDVYQNVAGAVVGVVIGLAVAELVLRIRRRAASSLAP